VYFVEFYYICPTGAQYVLTTTVSLQTFTQQSLQIKSEPTRKTVPASVVYRATSRVTIFFVL